MVVIKVLLILFAGSASIPNIALTVLFMAGIWKMFEKSGVKGWWALIPGAREYQLACCAGRESEGKAFSLAAIGATLLSAVDSLLPNHAANASELNVIDILVLIGMFALALVSFIYSIRVCSGLVEVYGVRRRWMWLWVLPYVDFIPALIWGFSNKYQPAWKVEDIKAEMARLATHGSASVMDA